MVTFAPDHESIHYSDGIHIELFSEVRPYLTFMSGSVISCISFVLFSNKDQGIKF